MTPHRTIGFPSLLSVPGLRFRHYDGPDDLPGMTSVIERSMAEDGEDHVTSLEDMRNSYANLKNCDPSEDILIVEVDGRIEGYGRHQWEQELNGLRRYQIVTKLAPHLRSLGVREAMFDWLEEGIRVQARGHPVGEKTLEVSVDEGERRLVALLEARGYRAVRILAEMLRKTLDDIPDIPLPDGVEVRPVLPEHHRRIYDAHIEAHRDSWGFTERDEDRDFCGFSSGRFFQPHLWQVAWHGDHVVGQVKPFILPDENEMFKRRRGYVEMISTAKAWRRKGVASALIARAFLRIRKEGMEEAALSVDTDNVDGAMRLYERMGFVREKVGYCYRKAIG